MTAMAHTLAALANGAVLLFVVTTMLAMGFSLTVSQILAPLHRVRLVVLALVASFQAFGTLLAVGPLLLPAAAARCWGFGAGASMVLATGFGLAASVAGLLVSYHANLPSGPAIVLAAGLLFGISLVATNGFRRLAPMIGREA